MRYLIFIFVLVLMVSCHHDKTFYFTNTSDIKIGGIIAQALNSSEYGRLTGYIIDENSHLVKIFNRDSAMKTTVEGWEGEFTGKWLYAAARCVIRTHDEKIAQHIKAVADFLVSQQDNNGYLGTFNDTARFTGIRKYPIQTYDLWVNGYIIQGLMECYKLFHQEKYINVAKKWGDLCIATFEKGNIKIVNVGCWGGTGSASILEHFVDCTV